MKKDQNNITPIGDFILLKMKPVEAENIDGIIVQRGTLLNPETKFQLLSGYEDSTEGTVLKVGEGRKTHKGVIIPIQVSAGDLVVVEKGSGNYANFKDGLKLVREADILYVAKYAPQPCSISTQKTG